MALESGSKTEQLTKAAPIEAAGDPESATGTGSRLGGSKYGTNDDGDGDDKGNGNKRTWRSRIVVVMKSWDDAPLGKFGTYLSFALLDKMILMRSPSLT